MGNAQVSNRIKFIVKQASYFLPTNVCIKMHQEGA